MRPWLIGPPSGPDLPLGRSFRQLPFRPSQYSYSTARPGRGTLPLVRIAPRCRLRLDALDHASPALGVHPVIGVDRHDLVLAPCEGGRCQRCLSTAGQGHSRAAALPRPEEPFREEQGICSASAVRDRNPAFPQVGAPGGIRTPDLLIRSIEARALCFSAFRLLTEKRDRLSYPL